MKYLLTTFALILSFASLANSAIKSETSTAHARVYFVYADKQLGYKKLIESRMQESPGGSVEVNSTTLGKQPGGYWFVELRFKENKQFSYQYWERTDGDIFKRYEKPLKSKKQSTIALETPRTHTVVLNETNEGALMLEVRLDDPKIVYQPVTITPQNYALNYMCFKNASIVMDDSFYLGNLNAFADELQLRIPDFLNLDISLNNKEGWKPVGSLTNGVISLDLPNGHMLNIHSVGIGFANLQAGGPINVFGLVSSPTLKLADAKSYVDYRLSKNNFTVERNKRLKEAAKKHPYGGLMGISAKMNDQLSPQFLQVVGSSFNTRKQCG